MEKKSYKNGPFAAPGNYTLRLTIDGKVIEQTFELLMDPRIAEYVTQDDINKQVSLHRNIKDLLSEARRKLDKLEKEKTKLEKKDKKSNDDLNRIEKVSSLISQLKTKEGIYELPVLVDQISYLYNMLGDTDQLPGRDVYERYEELKEKLEGLK